jgi:hypothetical protein
LAGPVPSLDSSPMPHPALIDVAAGRGLPSVSDPMSLMRSAFAHGVAGLLLTEVEHTDQPWRGLALPVLRKRESSVRAWHERLWTGLASMSRMMEEIGVEVAIAKGVAAESRWYSRLGERPCSDLDLVLSPGQVHRIDDIIAAVEPSHPLCGKARHFARSGLLQSVDLQYDGIPIDLHWDVLKIGVPSRNGQLIWDRAVAIPLPDGGTIRALDAESSFVHFLIHLNKDSFRRLLGFVDAARIYEREDLDMDVISRLVRADGIEASVACSWDVVVTTLGLPERDHRHPQTVRSLIWRSAWRRSIRLRASEPRVRFHHRQWLIAFLARGRLLEALRCRWALFFPSREFLEYVHSDYARRWGGEPVTGASGSRLWSLTMGRAQALRQRRRAISSVVATRSRGGAT